MGGDGVEAVATYLGHSGFLVEAGGEHGEKLVFDYLGRGLDESCLTDAWVFITHAHRDHCSSAALSLIERGLAHGIVSFDVTRKGLWRSVRPGDRVEAGGISVRVFGSTDEGVSFLVEAGGVRVFHAGDLNYWHWRAESTEAEVKEAYQAFDRVLSGIEGEKVDIAMFPVDPRMLEGYDEGALMFAERVKPSVLIPMHFWEDKEAPRAFCAKQMPQGVRAVSLTRPGESFLFRA
jgi:L-ascorbate metabolism protein UlaG (beta-lactamase superfamily)